MHAEFFNDKGLQDADSQVRFAHADGSGEQQAVAFGGNRISVDEPARRYVARGERGICSGEARLVAVKGAVLVATWDRGHFQQPGDALLKAAVAGFGGTRAIRTADDAHPHSIAYRAGWRHEGVFEQYRS